MLTLKSIMTTDLLVVTPETTLRDAMELFEEHHVSGAPVLREGTLVGVISTSDLLAFAAALPEAPGETASDLDEDGETQASDQEAADSEDESTSAFFWELWNDDSEADASEHMSAPDAPHTLEGHVVEEAMTRLPLLTLPPSASVEDAARLMESARVHRVLVTEGRRLLGLVSSLDIARAVSEHRLTKRVYVFGRRHQPRHQQPW